jgi:putative glycosyl hydrolase-like family 6 (GHL6) protein
MLQDHYHPPDWLRYARAIYFEGYAPPVFPHVRDFDAKRIVELSLELGGDTLRFQPIGYRATYPSKVFPTYPELGNRDLIDEVSMECRRAGMHLYCYCVLANGMDTKLIDDPRYADYVLRDAAGKPYGSSTGYGNAEEIKTCATGDPYRQMIRKVVYELCQHDTDGVYFDAPSGYRGICFCESCQAGFRKFSGMDLERLRNVHELEHPPENTDMKALGAWYDWANKLTEEDLVDLRKIIHGSGKFMLCHNGGTWRSGSFHLQYRYADGFMVEYSDEFYQRLVRALMGAAMARPTKKLAQTYMGGFDVAAIGHPPHNRPWTPHCLNLEDGDEIRMEGFADLAGGNMPLYGVVNRLLYRIGDGSTEPAKEVFSLARRAEPILKDSVPVAYVTIVPTAESLELSGRAAKAGT